jgi:hypothetical protein
MPILPGLCDTDENLEATIPCPFDPPQGVT